MMCGYWKQIDYVYCVREQNFIDMSIHTNIVINKAFVTLTLTVYIAPIRVVSTIIFIGVPSHMLTKVITAYTMGTNYFPTPKHCIFAC